VILIHALDQEHLTFRTGAAFRQDRLIGIGTIPGVGRAAIRERQHDQVIGEGALKLLLFTAVNDETAVEGRANVPSMLCR